jgi:ATP-dependent Zn protease
MAGMVSSFLTPLPPLYQDISLQHIVENIKQNNIHSIQVNNDMNKATIIKHNNEKVLLSTNPLIINKIVDVSIDKGIDVQYRMDNPLVKNILQFFGQSIIFAPFLYIVWSITSKIRPNINNFDINIEHALPSNISFAGSPEVLRECKEAIYFFNKKHPMINSFKGVLLEGPTGTGKTLIARIIARETNSSFVIADATSFIELYAGLGALRVRQLFSYAKENKPCIIFIDEIDAIAPKREDVQG